jgi:colanic acid/amylovoran biosynthesis protein
LKYIIITGGQLFNKGAQAMTFTVVDQMKRRYPDKEIVLLSIMDYKRSKSDREKYNFKIMPWFISIKLGFLNTIFQVGSDMYYWTYEKMRFIYRRIKRKKITKFHNYKSEKEDLKKILKQSSLMIDVSGYALSSQRGFKSSLNFLLNLVIAKKKKIKTYLLPQSFGPFEYKIYQKLLLFPIMKKYLKIPEIIFVREKDGLQYIRKFTEKNIEKSVDIVLNNYDYDKRNIFNNYDKNEHVEIKHNSVGIIPNVKIMIHGNSKEIYDLYRNIINNLLEHKKTVYILRHSAEDLNICKEIKNNFSDNGKVILLENDLDCIELNSIIKNFEFVIASRYHSVVHAYKNFVPVLILGWAIKYIELAKNFGQSQYCFDVRENINKEKIITMVKNLLRSYSLERKVIKENSKVLENTFDFDKIRI